MHACLESLLCYQLMLNLVFKGVFPAVACSGCAVPGKVSTDNVDLDVVPTTRCLTALIGRFEMLAS